MPYVARSAVIEIEWRCSRCGASGYERVDGDEYVGGLFGVEDMSCPECGLTLDNAANGGFDDDDCEYEHELEEK